MIGSRLTLAEQNKLEFCAQNLGGDFMITNKKKGDAETPPVEKENHFCAVPWQTLDSVNYTKAFLTMYSVVCSLVNLIVFISDSRN